PEIAARKEGPSSGKELHFRRVFRAWRNVQRTAASAINRALPAWLSDLQRRYSDRHRRVEHVSRTGTFSGTRESRVPARDFPHGPVRRCGGGAAVRATC